MRRRAGPTERLLATVMFTDIVGSTQLASEMGDRGWKELLARHHAVVRRELKRGGGREMDTAGDGFFAIFERPAAAIQCAAAIMDRLRPMGVRIRAGIHMGECEVMGGKVGGVTVHVGARVLGEADGNQILVTGTVRDMAVGSELRFVDQGVRALKGVPGEWRLFSVEPVVREREATLPDGGLGEPGNRTRMAIGAVLVALVAAVALVFLLTRDSAEPVIARTNSAVRIDPSTLEVVASIPAGDRPTGIASSGDAVWVISPASTLLSGIDLGSGIPSSIGLGNPPSGIAADARSVWITFGFTSEGYVLRYSTTTKQREQTIPVANGVRGVAVGEGAVWVANAIENTVTKIDPETGEHLEEIPVGEQPEAIAVGHGAVWVASVVDGSIWRLDPGTLQTQADVSLGVTPTAVTTGLGHVWVTSTAGNSVSVIDVETNSLVKTIPLRQGPRGIAVGTDAVWVALSGGALARIDPTALDADIPLQLPGPADGVVASEDAIWVTVQE
jgi:YVTN family beta-propeller protein